MRLIYLLAAWFTVSKMTVAVRKTIRLSRNSTVGGSNWKFMTLAAWSELPCGVLLIFHIPTNVMNYRTVDGELFI